VPKRACYAAGLARRGSLDADAFLRNTARSGSDPAPPSLLRPASAMLLSPAPVAPQPAWLAGLTDRRFSSPVRQAGNLRKPVRQQDGRLLQPRRQRQCHQALTRSTRAREVAGRSCNVATPLPTRQSKLAGGDGGCGEHASLGSHAGSFHSRVYDSKSTRARPIAALRWIRLSVTSTAEPAEAASGGWRVPGAAGW
jgi:hypothetical protein